MRARNVPLSGHANVRQGLPNDRPGDGDPDATIQRWDRHVREVKP